MMRYALFIAVFGVLPTICAGGDVLVMQDNETLTGDIARVEDGALVFRTSLAGQMMVPMDAVRSLSTERNFVITFANGDVHYGRFKQGAGGPVIVPLNGEAAHPVSLANVVEALPIPSAPQPDDAETPPKWQVSGETGLALRDTNRQRIEAATRIELRGELNQSQVEGTLSASGDGLEDGVNRAEGSMLWRDSTGGAAKPYIEARLEHDVDRAIEMRGELTLGLWDYLAESGRGRLEWFGGMNLTYEEWEAPSDNGPSPADLGPRKDENSRGEANVQLRLRYSRAIFHDGQIDKDLVFLPSISELGDIRARYETAVTVPLAAKLMLRLNLRLDFESDPELPGLDNWGASVGAGLRWDF